MLVMMDVGSACFCVTSLDPSFITAHHHTLPLTHRPAITGIAKQELMAMLEEEELKDAILLVFANKQDSRGALNSRQVP